MNSDMDRLMHLLEDADCDVKRNDVAFLINTLGECDDARHLFNKLTTDEWNKQRNVNDAEAARKKVGQSAVEAHREFVEVTRQVG